VIVEPVVVPVPLRAIEVQIQHVPVAIRVAQICRTPSMPLPLKLSRSQGCIEFRILNAIIFCTKCLLFFKLLANPPFETVVANALNLQTLDSAAGNLDHPRIRLLPILILHSFGRK